MNATDAAMLTFQGFAVTLGLVVGSFLNVCIARMPEDRSVVTPGSHCPACGHPVRPRDNIPVLSWLLLRGRCRDCGSAISPLYPAIELLTGMVAWLLFRRVVPDAAALDPAHAVAFLALFSFSAMLIGLTFIDVRHHIVPDAFSIYAVPFAVLAAAALSWLGYPGALGWQGAVVGALAGATVLLVPIGVYWLVRREEGMGWGDVKLMALIGAFLGALPAVPFVLFVASLAGSAVGLWTMARHGRTLRYALPFGPFLALAAMIWMLHGQELLRRTFPGLAMLLAG